MGGSISIKCFPFSAAVFLGLKSHFAACFKLCKLSFAQSVCLCVRMPECGGGGGSVGVVGGGSSGGRVCVFT